jgi:hypothetical protein
MRRYITKDSYYVHVLVINPPNLSGFFYKELQSTKQTVHDNTM